jgi:hypothetical protein
MLSDSSSGGTIAGVETVAASVRERHCTGTEAELLLLLRGGHVDSADRDARIAGEEQNYAIASAAVTCHLEREP